MPDPMRIGEGHTSAEQVFHTQLGKLRRRQPKIQLLEIGTRRWEKDPTHHKEWAPDMDWTFSDFKSGKDVDVVSDAHDLKEFADESFDVYISVSVYEHLQRPWVAAHAAARVLRPGGLVYIATHQTFPIHGYPDDYWRFTDAALSLIFEDAGFKVLRAGYGFPAKIVPGPEVTRWNTSAPAWLNVEMTAIRVAS